MFLINQKSGRRAIAVGLGIIDHIGEFDDLCVVTVNLPPRFVSSNKYGGYHGRNSAQLGGGFNPDLENIM